MTIEDRAYALFLHNVGDYSTPHHAQQAWQDPNVRAFWTQQVLVVLGIPE
jgi:hypothetical protein